MQSKERARLRALANPLDTTLQIGKGGITENLAAQLDQVLAARQLVKGMVLETSPVTAAEAAAALSQAVGAETVQVIGRRFVLYRRNPERPPLLS